MAEIAQQGRADSREFTRFHSNVCKGLAVLMLLFHHLFNDYPEYEGHVVDYFPLTGDQVTSIALLCKLCVAVFVFITGYGLASTFRARYEGQTTSAGELGRFAITRWWNLMARFWPVFVLALVCGPLGRSPLDVYGPGIRATLAQGIVDALGLANLMGTPTLNPTWWYMTLAIVLIFLLPPVMLAVRRFGSAFVLACVPLVLVFFGVCAPYDLYITSYLLGVFCSDRRLFDWWGQLGDGRRGVGAAKTLLAAALFCVLLPFRMSYNYLGLVDALLALLLCMIVMTCLANVPVLSTAAAFLGRHSANIFFTHTLLYSYYFLDFFYSFRYPAVILLVLTVASLVLSILLDTVEKRTGYARRMRDVGERIASVLTAPLD